MKFGVIFILLLGVLCEIVKCDSFKSEEARAESSLVSGRLEDLGAFQIETEESEYDKVSVERWNELNSEDRCRLILEKLESDYNKSINEAKNNLVLISILRPIPIDDSGSCFKRLILWHYEKVELIKSDPSIENYEDIVPVRLLLLGMSPNQIDKEPRDIAEIPEFLELACKNLLSQKPRMRWPLSGARYHPYIANIIGFQKVWMHRVVELLSACAQHIYQSSSGYLFTLLVSVEHIVDNNIFGDYENAWKGRSSKMNKEELIFDMDEKNKRKVIEFEIPDNKSVDSFVEIEEVTKPQTRNIDENKVVYSPNKLPVFEIPNSVSSEICLEVGTKEIPGLSSYKKLSDFNNENRYYNSIMVPPNREIERPVYTRIRPEDRATFDTNEYRNFWMRPNYVNKYGDTDKLQKYLLEKVHLNWPETDLTNVINIENRELYGPERNKRVFKDDVFEVYPSNNYNDDILQIGGIPSSSRGMLNLNRIKDAGRYDDSVPVLIPYQFSSNIGRYEYDSAYNDPQIQRYAYYDNYELPEEERSEIMDVSKTSDFYFPYKKVSMAADGYNSQPNLKLKYQGLLGKKIIKHPSFGYDKDETMIYDDEIDPQEASEAGQTESSGVPFSRFRDVARNAIAKWYVDESNGETSLTGRDRKILKKLFSFIDQVDPDHYSEYMNRGDDYIVRNIIRLGKSKDKNFDRMLSEVRSGRGGVRHKYSMYNLNTAGGKMSRNRKNAADSPLSKKNTKRRKEYSGSKKRGIHFDLPPQESESEESKGESEELDGIPKDIFIKDLVNEKYDFQNILKKERLKRYHKILKDEIEKRVNNIENKEKNMVKIEDGKTLRITLDNERKSRDRLENEYKKNLEEHAKILDLLKKNHEKMRLKMEEEHKKREDDTKEAMKGAMVQMEEALDTASNAINEIEKEKEFLNNKLKTLEGDNKHIRSLINMKDNYIKKIEKDRMELESKQALEMREMRENYEKELNDLRSNLKKDDAISGLNNMLSNLENEAKRKLEKIDDISLNDEKIKNSIERRLKEREKQLELAYQRQKNRDTEYMNYVIQLLESKESEDAKKVTSELKNKILELEEKQDELNHAREELELINDDLIQTVESQNINLKNLMKKSEDMKVQKETAMEELNIARNKLADIKQVEDGLKKQLRDIKENGAPSDEILNHLKKSLKLAEEEKKLALEVVQNAQVNYDNSDKNMKMAFDKLDKIRSKVDSQKVFEKELKNEIDRRYKINKNALKLSTIKEEEYEIKPLSEKETGELNRLRGLGLDELTDEEKKSLIMLGQRQLATMELSVVKTFNELNNQVTQVLDDEEKEKSNILWEQVSDTKINRMELENSIGNILLEKIQGQEDTIQNMKSLLQETQSTITELNKQLLLQRELSEEASSNKGTSSFQIYDNDKNRDEELSVFGEEMSNDIVMQVEESVSVNNEKTPTLLMRELETKLNKRKDKGVASTEDGKDEAKMGKDEENGGVETGTQVEKGTSIAYGGNGNNNLGRMEHSASPISTMQRISMQETMNYNKKDTFFGDTKYEVIVNKHDNPILQDKYTAEENNVVYMLHDIQKEREPSKLITCENIVSSIRKSLNQYLAKYEEKAGLSSSSAETTSHSEVMSRTVLPGMQYDECYNSTIIEFENYQQTMQDKGIYIKLFVLLTDFKDTLMIGDLSKTGYKMSNIPELIYRVLSDTISKRENKYGERIETVINNFPSEWIHEHIRTCKDLISGKSLESITRMSLSQSSMYNGLMGFEGGGGGSNSGALHSHMLPRDHPPIYVGNIEVTPRPDKEPCIRLVKRIKQRVSEINGLLMRKKELQDRLKIRNPQDKLFVFTFEDIVPYDLNNQFTTHYCEKYIIDLFIKINNMEWRANKFKNNNSLIRLMIIPTSSNSDYVSDSYLNLDEWKSEGIRLSYDEDIVNNWMGNSLMDYLTNKRLLRSGLYFSNEVAKKIIIGILDSINYYGKDRLAVEGGDSEGEEGKADEGRVGSSSNENGGTSKNNGFIGGIINAVREKMSADTNNSNKSERKQDVIPGILLLLRTSNLIPENTAINPTLLDLRPNESPYLIEAVKRGNNDQE
ncbi:hypothetical protein FG386_003304 [Cryptosporidium ryanae]|uniref:uncharacterized protein n=1 Tax=Cryptosporidium ryanae TaxID=515981 RepID=UPI003519EBDF|nr:hypothetical protein FG386_003304 [Cryptosporidium ryanae]